MRLRTRGRVGRAIAAATVVGVIAAPLALTTGTAQAETAKVPPLKVMTRNLYLGVDIQRPLVATAGATSQDDLITKLGNEADAMWDTVEQTDFGVRSKLLADEIAAARPDLVGLQEVALWRSGPVGMGGVLVPSASVVEYDFLAMLRKELKAAGVPYRAVSVNTLSDVEAPAFLGTYAGDFAAPGITEERNIRVTMHDVILKRVGSGIGVLRHRERAYAPEAQLPFEIGPVALNFKRGYQWIDAERGAKKFRFINTHLEAFSSDIAFAQMKEMLEGPASKERTTIIACDCNSDPLNQSVKTSIGDTLPHSEPYWLATGEHEYFDTWLQWKPARFGWTSGLSETVDDATADGFDHRIDLILGKRGDGSPLRVVGGQVTGDELADRDPTTGLWPSDHAGVVISLRRL